MTNGEKLVKVFPDIELYKKMHGGIQIDFDSTWWNAEYKEPTTPNDCETCIHNKGVLECDMYGCKYESTTKNDLGVDCIDRKFAISVLNDVFHGAISDSNMRVYEIINWLNGLPSVTPQEPKTGHWNDIPKYKDIAWQCSECGHFTTMKHNYCPECGAKMVEPQESEK